MGKTVGLELGFAVLGAGEGGTEGLPEGCGVGRVVGMGDGLVVG